MKLLYIATVFIFVCCGQQNSNSDENKITNIDTTKTFILTDKTIKFLWRDSSNAIIINQNFCKTISYPEKAALGYVATYIGSECSWDGIFTDKENSLKCEVLTALNLGYQCSDQHLGFLRQWFKNDTTVLKKLKDCPMIPNSATIQETFNEITLTVKGNEIVVFFEAIGFNMREETSWDWTETIYFQADSNNIKLIKREQSNVHIEHFDPDNI